MNDLYSWLNYLEKLNPNKIELGLERIQTVFSRFNITKIAPKVIVVAGTNGKGSTISYIESVLLAAGYSVAKYTSPHIFSFTERIVFNKKEISEKKLVEALNYVKKHQQDTKLSYFEFTTLAAFYSIAQQKIDVALLEIGLGGRLDAVNIAKRDINLLTNIDLDHTEWLGDTREKIAIEKVAIAQQGVPFYIAELDKLNAFDVLKNQNLCETKFIGKDFTIKNDTYFDGKESIKLKQVPPLKHQKNNLALALTALNELKRSGYKINNVHINQGIKNAVVFARQTIIYLDDKKILVDAAHNEASVSALSDFLESNKHKKVHAVFSVSDDKNILKMVANISEQVDKWHVAPFENKRSVKKQKLNDVFSQNSLKYQLYESLDLAFQSAKKSFEKGELIVVFGSFFVIDELRKELLIEN